MRHENLLKVSRVEGITDGVFATAMTILIFTIQLPPGANVNTLAEVLQGPIVVSVLIYIGSFIILGMQWVSINFLHGFVERVNRPYLWVNILYLIPSGIVPFSTSLVIDYPQSHVSMTFYVFNLICSNLIMILVWNVGVYYKLYNEAYTPEVRKMVVRRMCVPFIFYISSIIVSHWNTAVAFAILIAQPVVHMMPGKIDRYVKRHELGCDDH